MTTPALAEASETESISKPTARRSHKIRHLALGLVAVVGVMFMSTACSPEAMAKQAIAKHFGVKDSPCAERIAARESNFQPGAINHSSGTVGLFQISPVHAAWVKATYGYSMSELTDADKNARVAKGLTEEAYKYYGDGWQPWRMTGRAVHDGSCPA